MHCNLLVNIYALINPITNKVFYVGCTYKEMHVRLKGHINDTYPSKKSKVIKDIIEAGLLPKIKLLDIVRYHEANLKERYYYNYYKSLGCEMPQSPYAFHYKTMFSGRAFYGAEHGAFLLDIEDDLFLTIKNIAIKNNTSFNTEVNKAIDYWIKINGNPKTHLLANS